MLASQQQNNQKPIDVTLNKIFDQSMLNMNLDVLRKKFPLSDRFSLCLCGCGLSQTPIQMISAQKPLYSFEDHYKEARHSYQALKIKVAETGSLMLDPNMIHPFVRIHFVDLTTNKYLRKS
mmetsp:Transcript_39561/g.38073  ORF Transcript_39561/g.38073 Transcript_39561/m.38073 type:complete len:121 (-) Transcript_39561:180-542(-)